MISRTLSTHLRRIHSITLDPLEPRTLLNALFVTPLSTPIDSTHFHSLGDAYTAATPGGSITILPGAFPESDVITLAKINLTVQGDLRVSALTLPRYNLTLGASGINLTHLAINALIINGGSGLETVRNCDIFSITVTGNAVSGDGFNTFDSNTIEGFINVTGGMSPPPGVFDAFTHNTIQSRNTPAVTVNNDDGFTFTDNTLVEEGPAGAIGLGATGVLANMLIARNSITATSAPLDITSPSASGTISDNTLVSHVKGTGLIVGSQNLDGIALRVQGNNFVNNLVGFVYSGGTTNTTISVDLGGGSQGSLGGNDFRGFTGAGSSYSIQINKVQNTATLFANNNIFTSGSTASIHAIQGIIQTTALSPTQALISNLYEELLHRGPMAADYTYWASVYTAQGQSAVVAGILHSTEALGDIVDGYYRQYLNRGSDSTGLNFWITQIQSGMTLETVQASLIASPEFIAGHNADFVQSLYLNVLHRPAESTDIAYWYAQLPTLGLTGVASAIIKSTENRSAFIISLFQTYYYRTPVAADVTFFLNTNDDFLTLDSVIFGTPEYLTRD